MILLYILPIERRTKNLRKVILMVAFILSLNALVPIAHADSDDKIHKIEQFVEEQREISQIPGISLVIVEKGKTVYQKGFGYGDVKEKTPVTSNTLFELASTSKAFTGLAILQLEKDGLLNRTDDVRKYIPWLELEFEGEPQTITINQLLHHTSGIASNTIVHIPESNAQNALELTVRTLLDHPLNREPGSSFEYATLNYDVLGLVIENVSKQPYDVNIKEQLLEQIGMKDSYVGLHHVKSDELATGYKIGFMREQKYTPPFYRGNIPAAYIISNTNDIAKWLNLQLGSIQNDTFDKQTIEESHIPDQSVEPFYQEYYASGWSILKKDDKQYILHAGQNPTFSSYFIMQPNEQLGVAVLSNMNTTFTTAIGQGVIDLWEGNNVNTNHSDSYQKMDQIVTILCIIVVCLGIIFSILLLRSLWKFKIKQRTWVALKGKRIFLLVFHSLFVAAILILMMVVPKILLGMNWEFIRVWAPTSISSFYYSVIATIIIYYLFVLLLIITKKGNFIR
jgi:CubicO group peptidase (beta-lactamase class C family)